MPRIAQNDKKMPTSPKAIENFLAARGPKPINVKGRDPEWLLDFIHKICGAEPTFKTLPRQVQYEGLAFALWARNTLLHYDLRTGKTKLALDWITYLKDTGRVKKRAFIIAHAPIGVDVWEGQIAQHSDLNIRSIRSGPDAFDRLCDAIDDPLCCGIVITWVTLHWMFGVKHTVRTKKTKREFNKLFVDHERTRAVAEFFDVLVIDEIHRCADPTTIWWKIANDISEHCQWHLGLTGTPFGRDPYDEWGQAYLIDRGDALSRNPMFFREAFGKKKYNHFTKSKSEYVFDEKKMPILREKLEHMMLSCKLEEVHEVNVLAGVINLRMSPTQSRAYREVIEKFIHVGKDDFVAVENVFLRLRQVASGYLPIIDDYGEQQILEFFDAPKYLWLEDLVTELGNEIKFVIFHEFRPTGERICRILEKAKINYRWLYGGTRDRAGTLRDFQEGDAQCLVANAATGGTGTDMSAADYLIMFESPVDIIARQQALGRPLARGARPLVVDDLICAPVEQKLYNFAQQGANLLAELRRDPREVIRGLQR